MSNGSNWSGEERRREDRRKILERRRQERADAKAGRRKVERRREQICLVCRSAFVPKTSGEVICPQCRIDGARGGKRSDRDRPPF